MNIECAGRPGAVYTSAADAESWDVCTVIPRPVGLVI